jgi:outer membrane protein TolC
VLCAALRRHRALRLQYRTELQKPTVAVPPTYRGLAPDGTAQTETATVGDKKWWDIFQDEQLRTLIRTALQQNYDLRIAASRILEAKAQLGITRADQCVSDALVAYRKMREFRAQQELLFQSAEDAARLSHMRYTGGVIASRSWRPLGLA